MGQTEAPLTIRPFLSKATRSELMTIMTSGMAHVSGGIMAMYIAQGVEARHLLSAVIMTSPGTILMAKMLVPETEVPATEGKVVIPKDELHKDENFIGAIARGTIDGRKWRRSKVRSPRLPEPPEPLVAPREPKRCGSRCLPPASGRAIPSSRPRLVFSRPPVRLCGRARLPF